MSTVSIYVGNTLVCEHASRQVITAISPTAAAVLCDSNTTELRLRPNACTASALRLILNTVLRDSNALLPLGDNLIEGIEIYEAAIALGIAERASHLVEEICDTITSEDICFNEIDAVVRLHPTDQIYKHLVKILRKRLSRGAMSDSDAFLEYFHGIPDFVDSVLHEPEAPQSSTPKRQAYSHKEANSQKNHVQLDWEAIGRRRGVTGLRKSGPTRVSDDAR